MCKNLEGRELQMAHNVFARNPELTELSNLLQGKLSHKWVKNFLIIISAAFLFSRKGVQQGDFLKNSFITTYGYEDEKGKQVVKFVRLGKPSSKIQKLVEKQPFLQDKTRPLTTKMDKGANIIAEGINDSSLSLEKLKVLHPNLGFKSKML